MCSVVGCDSLRRSAQRFKLPEDPEKRLDWVQFLATVNKQRFKESSWTDITICNEHFTDDCFVNLASTGTVQLKPSAVPSLCAKSEPDQEPVETPDVASQCDQLKTCDSPSSCSEESSQTTMAVPVSPVLSDTSDTDYAQMLQKIVNIDMIREKAALLQMKGKYVVNENRLLQLFSSKCPLCGSKVKVEKVIHGVLVILNQQCLQCEYRNQWKSQVNARVPRAEDQHLIGGKDVISETVSEESDPLDETEESSDQGHMDSDEDWKPTKELILANKLQNESDEETEDDEIEEYIDYPSLTPKHTQLCTECGRFFNKQRPHTCEHKIKPYSCNICGKRCVSEIALNSHSRVHDENYEHRCKYCHITFKTKVDKVTHEQIHLTQGKPYKCPDCSETFATNKERQIHLEDHRGPKQLKCHICGIEFNRTLSIRRHLVVHTGVKPFKCSVCQRGFNQAGHLKSHMRLHTGERPYKCQHCDKCFNHNVSLKSHVQRYHTSSSGCQRKRGKTNCDTVDAQNNESTRSADSGLYNAEEDHDEEERAEKERIDLPKKKKRSTGRPIGRPKRNAGEMQSPGSNTRTGKYKVQKLMRAHCSDEESEDEPTESDISFNSKEEEEVERTEKVTLSTRRSRGRPKNSDSDTGFDREDSKKKRL
ncbi:zinc finger protein 239-like isoform X2 [Toxotes jaculatrix]|uniref:zinc finger protein 239-like isoform X2 n=1 Tax=Toxotes jaculatrix TaxID=941984 RepID=UPI001B3AAF70|nr:zinc finger protein 239-like isoform X2 [Toxotes jaculatrix]